MDLSSMLNSSTAPTNMEVQAVSLYRRLSNSSPSASPGQSPVVRKQSLQRQSSDSFRTPELPASASKDKSPPLKRKIDQVDGASMSESEKSPTSTKKPATPTTMDHGASQAPTPMMKSAVRAQPGTCYDGSKPLSEVTLEVKDAILHFLTADPSTYGKFGLEIEAKLGRITEKDAPPGQEQRFGALFPIDSPVLLHPGYDSIRFQSNMTSEQHAKYNKHLNEQVELQDPKRKGYDPSRPKMTYKHIRVTDTQYDPISMHGARLKPRVTTDDKTGAVLETIAKENMAQLHIICPRHPFDIRLSINLEHRVEKPTGQAPIYSRKKDRLCYSLPTHQIDLTKVDAESKSSYELEIEMTDMENLKRQAEAVVNGLPNSFEQIVCGFMGSVMKLNTTGKTFVPKDSV